MKKLYILIILANVIAFAQIDSLWVRGAAYTNMPTWFGANTERGLTYNPVTNKVYVVSRNGGNFVKAINAETGADLADISVVGVTGGTYSLNDIESSQDGQMFLCNLANSATDVFKIYRYQTELSDPVVVFQSDFGGVNAKRMGDNITVIGSVSDNSVEIWAPDVTGNKIQVLGTTDNGATFTVKRTITLPAGTLGSAASVYPIPQDSLITLNGAGKNLTVWKWDGTYIGQVPGGIIATGTTATKLFQFPNTNQRFIATYQYVGQANARIVDMDGKSPEYYRNFAISPNIGTAANINGTGDVSFKYNTDGSVTMFVLGTNNGIGAYRLTRPYYINGRLHENYILTGTKQNNNAGFGTNIDLQKLYYNVDATHLYISGEAKLTKANQDGIVIFLNVSKLNGTGATPGTALGGVTNGGHLFGDVTNPNFKNDFETHFGFAMNMGGTDSLVFFDAAKYSTGNKTGAYLGSTYQSGTASMGPATGGIFTANSITFAFDSAYGVRRGFEIKIPLSEIGNPTSADNIQLFGAVVSSTAYFSDVTVPGNVAGLGNLGFNANFLTTAGGPYHTGSFPVPVELVSFTSSVTGKQVTLEWETATEKNNHGFYIEKSVDGENYTQRGFISGKGTTIEHTTYKYTEENAENGKYYYRLRQMDYDGTCEYSDAIEVEVNYNPNTFELTQNYPNPFNPSTVIRFTVPVAGQTTLKVYNALGQEVATLFSEIAEAGTAYSVDFNAGKLVSGVYLYELKSGVNTSMKKMMLIK